MADVLRTPCCWRLQDIAKATHEEHVTVMASTATSKTASCQTGCKLGTVAGRQTGQYLHARYRSEAIWQQVAPHCTNKGQQPTQNKVRALLWFNQGTQSISQ